MSRLHFRSFQGAQGGASAVRPPDRLRNAEERRIKSRPRYQRRRPCLCESQILAAACLASQPTSLLEFPCFVTPLKVHSTGKNDVENRGTRRREILQERSAQDHSTWGPIEKVGPSKVISSAPILVNSLLFFTDE